MAERWWGIATWKDKPFPCRVVKHTPSSVIIEREYFGKLNKSRRARETDSCAYFPTYEEARKGMIDKATKQVDDAKATLGRARMKLEKALALPETEPAVTEQEELDAH